MKQNGLFWTPQVMSCMDLGNTGKDKARIFDFVDDHGVFEASARARYYTYERQGIPGF